MEDVRFTKTYVYHKIFVFLFALFSLVNADAVPSTITLQTKIVKPNGSNLTAPSVDFQITTLDPLGTCVLFVESFSGINMSTSDGLMIASLGTGAIIYSAGSNLSSVFNNQTSSFNCRAGGSYVPSLNDRRKIVMQFNDGSGWQTTPGMDVNSVPFAFYANDSEKFSGHQASEFVFKSALSDCASSGKVLSYNGAAFTCVSPNTSAGTVTAVTSANSYLSVATTTSTPVITANVGTGANTLAAGDDSRIVGALQKASNLSDLSSVAAARTNLGLGSAAVLDASSLINTSTSLGGDLSGTVGAASVTNVGSKTAAQVAQSVTDTQAATTAATANTIVKRDISGSANLNTLVTINISSTSSSTKNAYLYDPTSTNRVLVKASPSGSDYTMYLPKTIGAANQILGYDATGVGLENKTITAGAGVSVTHTDGGIEISAAGSGGTVTSVSSANSDIAVATGATSAVLTLNTGTSANQIVKLDGLARLPETDGSAITNLDPTHLSAAVPINKGGTNATTANAGLNNLLPAQAANANKFLQTDGTNTSWVSVSSANSYLSISNGSSTALITANVGTSANTLAAGNDARITGAVQQTAYNGDFANVLDSNCGTGSTPKWNAATDMWTCVAIDGLPASAITTGVLNTARLGSGTANNTTFLRGDGTWVVPSLTGGGIQTGLTNTVALGAACPTVGALAKTAAGDLVVCDDAPTVLESTDCSSIGVGALTFDQGGNLYVCSN